MMINLMSMGNQDQQDRRETMMAKMDHWPDGIIDSDFGVYKPRPMEFLNHWLDDGWGIKAYGMSSNPGFATP